MANGELVRGCIDEEVFDECANVQFNPSIGRTVECVFIHVKGGDRGWVYATCNIL
jgi:hypothetical protein